MRLSKAWCQYSRDVLEPALRSGRYKQNRTSLHSAADEPPAFCCLGVICDLENAAGWYKNAIWIDYDYKGETKGAVLPEALKKKIHMPSLLEARLITLNDDEESDFTGIADYLEAIRKSNEWRWDEQSTSNL